MGGGDHRDGLAGDIDAEFQEAGVDGREVGDDEVRRSVGDVQVDTLAAQALHLVVDGARDDIARGQFLPWVEARHEALPIRQDEARTLTAQRLGDQVGAGLRVIEAGRVELHELHVRHPAAGTPGHGDAVTGRHIGVAGIEIDLVGPAGGQHHEAGQKGLHPARGQVQDIGAEAAMRAGLADVPRGDQVHGDMLLMEADPWAFAYPRLQGDGNGRPGGVCGMDDPPMAVSTLLREVIAFGGGRGRVAGEGHPLVEQPADILRAMFDHRPDHLRIAQTGPGRQGILDMGFQRVLGVEYGGDPPLGVAGAAFAQVPLGDHGHREVRV